MVNFFSSPPPAVTRTPIPAKTIEADGSREASGRDSDSGSLSGEESDSAEQISVGELSEPSSDSSEEVSTKKEREKKKGRLRAKEFY